MKLGKEEPVGSEGDEPSSDSSVTETTVEDKEQPVPEPAAETEAVEQPAKDKKEDVENLRTIIKVNKDESQTGEKKEGVPDEEKKEEFPNQKTEEKPDKTASLKLSVPTATPSDDSRSKLEEKRNILQTIKDFDFQIKKNQENVNKSVEKIDGLTKDLDDLVSLYEIVSEQMNPFVGLSKVTKKRIDALENFTREMEDVKTRMSDLESEMEKNLGGVKRMKKDFEKNIDSSSSKLDNESESELEKVDISTEEMSSEITGEQESELKDKLTPTENIDDKSLPSNAMQFVAGDLSNDDLDKILSRSLENLLAEQNIESIINEFLLSLK